jgi:hypothetical protein
MPLAVKLLLAGVGLLGALYGLTLLRDHKDATSRARRSSPRAKRRSCHPALHRLKCPASAPGVTSPSSQIAAASASGSASAPTGTMPLIAKRMKAVVAALAHQPPGAQPDTSAAQPNVAAALVPPAPAASAVK